PSTTVTITATTPGTPDPPGTIALPAGNTLKVVGDGTTLPCGGNMNNGKLTITIGSGTDCSDIVAQQEQTIDEPYGSSAPAFFGPFNDDRIYCINLKDVGGMMGCTGG